MLHASKTHVRRLALAACCLLAPLLVAAGVAWACTPQSYISLRPAAAASGSSMTVEGNQFYPDGRVEIRWSSAEGPLLAVASGPSFSTKATIPEAPPGVSYVVATGFGPEGQVTGRSAAAFEVLPSPQLSLRSQSGLAGRPVTVDGSDFAAEGPVELHWDSEAGPLLGTATGPTFSTEITIPEASPGGYAVHAVGYDEEGNPVGRDSSRFEVTVAPAQPPPKAWPPSPSPLLDSAGPTLVGDALRNANRRRTISREGRFRLFCGSFEELGVTGTCSAMSSRAGTAKERGRFLRLGARPFRAEPGRPVFARFRLSKTNLRMLEDARRIRMRGSVLARDAVGNTTRRTFRFELRAQPKAARRHRR